MAFLVLLDLWGRGWGVILGDLTILAYIMVGVGEFGLYNCEVWGICIGTGTQSTFPMQVRPTIKLHMYRDLLN